MLNICFLIFAILRLIFLFEGDRLHPGGVFKEEDIGWEDSDLHDLIMLEPEDEMPELSSKAGEDEGSEYSYQPDLNGHLHHPLPAAEVILEEKPEPVVVVDPDTVDC